jgi:hypothetical protein
MLEHDSGLVAGSVYAGHSTSPHNSGSVNFEWVIDVRGFVTHNVNLSAESFVSEPGIVMGNYSPNNSAQGDLYDITQALNRLCDKPTPMIAPDPEISRVLGEMLGLVEAMRQDVDEKVDKLVKDKLAPIHEELTKRYHEVPENVFGNLI